MKKQCLFHKTIIATAILSLTGCTTFNNVSNINKDIKEKEQKAQIQLDEARNPSNSGARETIRYMKNQWVHLKPIALKETSTPPALRCKIKIATNEPVSILEVGQIVTKYCGVPVRITPDALGAIDNPLADDSQAPTQQPTNPPPMMMGMGGMPSLQNASTNTRLIDINYNGELKGLLDMVTARFGISWKEEDGKVKIYNLDSEIFYLSTLASDTDMRSDMQSGTTMVNGSSGGSGGTSESTGGVGGQGSSNQSTVVTLKTSIWSDIKNTVNSMKSPKGRINVSPSTGAVVVTDNADVLGRVKNYIEKENENLLKQVIFNIKIVSVTTTDTDSLGISWNAVYQSLSGKYGFKLASTFNAPDGATSGTFSILKGNNSRWGGTDAIVKALSEQGNVSIVKQPTASTLNLQPVALQVARQDGFLAGSSTTTTSDVGATTSLQTGIITTGFNMSLLPYVMQDNRMLLQFSINLSSLRNLRKVESGNASGEVPEIDLPINSTQKVRLNAGDTLMLTGFDQEDQASTKKGVLTPSNFLFGGGVNAKKNKTTLVVLITPQIMD